MEIKYLKTFQTIVQEGSFKKAAEKLNYTQSTITFQVQQLEQDLSTKLFEKLGRRMILTKAGESLIPYVSDTLAAVDRMQCFQRDLSEYRGELHIGVGESLLCFKLPPVLKRFHSAAPRARLFLRSMNCYEIRDELLDGVLDLGVFYTDVGGFGQSVAPRPFGRYPVVLVASPAVKAAHPDFKTADQSIPLTFIINEPKCVYRQMFERYLQQKNIRLNHTIELWSIPTIKSLVENNMGITYLPRFAVEEELRRGTLVELELDSPQPPITAACCHHKNKWVSPLMRLFLEVCTDDTQVCQHPEGGKF